MSLVKRMFISILASSSLILFKNFFYVA